MVPSGWEKHLVGKICTSIVPGRNKPKVFDGDIPWVTTPEITDRYIPSKNHGLFVSQEALQEAGGKTVPKGAVIMAAVGELGLVAIAKQELVINQQLHAFVCSPDVLNEFLAYWLVSQKSYMLSIASKTTIPYLNKSNCESVPVWLPPIPEQKKIAQILSTWDQAITTTEQLLANSQQQKKALMQQLLTGKKRLHDQTGQPFTGEWNLVEVGEFLSESRVPSSNNDPSKRLTVRLNLKGIEPREFRGTEAVDSTAHFVRSAGQFIYGKQNIHKGAFGIIPVELDGFETSQDLPAFDFTGKCDSLWFFHVMSQEHFFASLEDKMSGTGSKRLNPKTFFKVKLLCPQLEEQQKLATVLTANDNVIDTLKQKLDHLKQEKKALMQQLLSGKRRVKVSS